MFVSMYRCKLCNETFIRDGAKTRIGIFFKDFCTAHNAVTHVCDNLSIGSSEFLGWKYYEESDKNKKI